MPKTCAVITNRGVPGGCGMPRILATAVNSPASQKGSWRAMVRRYTANGTAMASAANQRLTARSVTGSVLPDGWWGARARARQSRAATARDSAPYGFLGLGLRLV